MKILALDTATEACSVALMVDGQISEKFSLAPREHNRIILPMIQELLAESQSTLTMLDAIAFGCGPGSFTGIRIAAGVVQGLSLGLDLPVIPISTLAALAFEAMVECQAEHVHAAIDARMGEVYWGSFRKSEGDAVMRMREERVLPPDAISVAASQGDVGTGSGWMTYRSILTERLGQPNIRILENRFPRSGSIVRLAATDFQRGIFCRAEDVEPVYLRNDVAKKPATKA
jgi:tRNA threonylcarbamoyladenosine biosynthesis protein TsaB